MPIYDYVCGSCNHRFEVLRGLNEAGPHQCPECGGPVTRAFAPPTIHFKGSGWAKVDRRYSGAPTKKASPKGTGDDAGGSGGSRDDSAGSRGPGGSGDSGGSGASGGDSGGSDGSRESGSSSREGGSGSRESSGSSEGGSSSRGESGSASKRAAPPSPGTGD